MDRLIALCGLRFRIELRLLSRTRERAFGLLLLLPGLLLFSGLAAFVLFFLVRGAGASELLVPALSALATFFGLTWSLSPLLAGVAFTESHDVARLMHFPIPLRTLVASSLIANLGQPLVLAEAPVLLALALALSRATAWFPLALAGVCLSFGFTLGFAQLVGLLLQGLARNRRLHDWAMFLGLGAGFLLSLLPLLLFASGGRFLPTLVSLVTAHDVLALSPFAWGVRAAVSGGRGELLPFLGWSALAGLGTVAVAGGSMLLVQRIHRGELDLGRAAPATDRAGTRMLGGGPLGALVEKDLRGAWRDPALKATLFMGMLGPLLFWFVVSQSGGSGSGRGLLLLATFVGMSSIGANVFGLERRGIALLLGFPIARWRILVAKNLGALALRLPGLLMLIVAGLLMAPAALVPAALTIALVTAVLAFGMDNFIAILFPIAAPAPGANPYGPVSGSRGLGAMLVSAMLLAATLLLASPFTLLAWLPLMLGQPWLWLASLPLALAGALSVYAMLIAGAEKLFLRREPEMLERILGES